MEQRVLFPKSMQKKFFEMVKYNLNSPSLRRILQFGFDTPYSTLKGYYNERLLLPKSLFENLCHIAKINPKKLTFQYISSNWGQIKGGKIGMRIVQKKYKKEIVGWRMKGTINSPISGKNMKKDII